MDAKKGKGRKGKRKLKEVAPVKEEAENEKINPPKKKRKISTKTPQQEKKRPRRNWISRRKKKVVDSVEKKNEEKDNEASTNGKNEEGLPPPKVDEENNDEGKDKFKTPVPGKKSFLHGLIAPIITPISTWLGLNPSEGDLPPTKSDNSSLDPPSPSIEKTEEVRESKKIKDEDIITFQDVKLEKTISSGTFGEVWKGIYKSKPIAVKILKNTVITAQTMDEFYQEAKLLASAKHENIIEFIGIIVDPPRLAILTEFAEKGSLHSMIHNASMKMSNASVFKMTVDILTGLSFLHSHQPPIIHRDIKPANLLVMNSDRIKICDLGVSRERSATGVSMTGFVGTVAYMSPELISNTHYDEKVDIFSFAVVLWEMLVRQSPWKGMNQIQIAMAVKKGSRLPLDQLNNPKWGSLIRKSWDTKSTNRPSANQLLEQLQELKSELIETK